MLLVIKGFMFMKTIGSIWLKRLSCSLCPWIVFSSNNIFVENDLPRLVEKDHEHMCNQHWLDVCQPFAHLISGCWKECTTYLLWLSTLFLVIGRKSMWLLAYVKW
jgi:hypothetical protein